LQQILKPPEDLPGKNIKNFFRDSLKNNFPAPIFFGNFLEKLFSRIKILPTTFLQKFRKKIS